MKKAIVASGGKDFIPLVEGLEETASEEGEKSPQDSQSGTVIMWEAYESKTMKQVRLIEQSSPSFLDNHNTVRRTIDNGTFKDGTSIMPPTSGETAEVIASLDNVADTTDIEAQPLELISFTDRLYDPGKPTN